MAKFFQRLAGGYQEKELLMQITLEKFQCISKQPFLKLFIEFKRGDKVERTECPVQIAAGETITPINQTFNKLSIFYQKKDAKKPEFQEKLTTIRLFGLQTDKKLTLLGERQIDVSTFVGKIREQVPLPLIGGALDKKNQLFILISIVPADQSHKIGVAANQVAREETSVTQQPPEVKQEETKKEEIAVSQVVEVAEVQQEQTIEERLNVEQEEEIVAAEPEVVPEPTKSEKMLLSEIEQLKIANESLKKQNLVLEETIEHHRSTDPKPVKASDLGRLRIKLEHKDEQIAQLERQVAELQAEIHQLKA